VSTIIRPSFLFRIGSITVMGYAVTLGYAKMGAFVRAVFKASDDLFSSLVHLKGRPFSVNRYRGSARSENLLTKAEW